MSVRKLDDDFGNSEMSGSEMMRVNDDGTNSEFTDGSAIVRVGADGKPTANAEKDASYFEGERPNTSSN